MIGKHSSALILCTLIAARLVVSSLSTAGRDDSECQQERADIIKMKINFAKYQTDTLLQLQEIFDGEQNCSPCPKCDDDRLSTKLAESEAKLAEGKARQAQIGTELQQTKSRLAHTETHLLRTAAKLAGKEDELAHSLTAVAQKETELAQAKSKFAVTKASLDQIKARLAGKGAELAQERAALREKDAELAHTSVLLQEKDIELAQANATLNDKDAELAQTSVALRDRETELAQTSAALRDKETELAQTSAALRDKETELAQKEEMLQSKETKLAELNSKLEECEARQTETAPEVAEDTTKLAQNVTHLVEARTQVTENQRYLAQLEAQLAENVAKLAKMEQKLKKKNKALANCRNHSDSVPALQTVAKIPASPAEITPDPETYTMIYFGTDGDGLQAYSLETSEAAQLGGSTRDLYVYGVAYDSIHDKIYWSGRSAIYRANRNGTQVETFFRKEQYGTFRGLGFDWKTSHLYAVTRNGFILIFNATGMAPVTKNCVPVLSSQGVLFGIALNPSARYMFWTVDSYLGSVNRARMDGSHAVRLVTGLKYPRGIAVDSQGARLYWTTASFDANRLQSSDIHGMDVYTMVRRTAGPIMQGIAVFGHRIYWTNYGTKQLESMTTGKEELRVLHTARRGISHLAIVHAAKKF